MAALTPFRPAAQIVLIILGVAVIILTLLQNRGSGLGSVFGSTGTVHKTRRGIDRLLFNMTILFFALFCVLSIGLAATPAQ
ncbi:MAG TPA: preprotein translocase subunit SecG [Ktedonobacterales bacterium]